MGTKHKKKQKRAKQQRKLPTDLATMLDQCESPIERRLLRALRFALPDGVVLCCQAPVGMYRADFLAERADLRVVIEADGREFHTSPEQREYDQRRDEYMIKKGYRVLRYTGSQITADARTCAAGVVAVFESTPIPEPKPRISRADRRERTRRNTAGRRAHRLAVANAALLRQHEWTPPPLAPARPAEAPAVRHIGTILSF